MRKAIGMIAAALTLTGVAAVPAQARHVPATGFIETDLVSDVPGRARIQDPDLVNPWGLALSSTGPLWVANNKTAAATVYAGGAAMIIKQPLRVSVGGGAPTGQVFNDTTAFVVNGMPARFIFAGESGAITAWNPRTGATAVQVGGADGAGYKGLALLHGPRGPVLLAADFHHARIDVFDQHFQRIRQSPWTFRDPALPPGYAPFNVAVIGERVLVTYARQDATGMDEVVGPGRGYLDEYGPFGRLHRRVASRGVLNAPWGLAVAPPGFGDVAGDLLVGNFGDGRINVFDPRGHRRGTLRRMTGQPIVIDGLWALQPGTAATGGTDSVWFSAGPVDESHGLVGLLQPGVG